MKPGTVIRLPDGRLGTVVYHGPLGYGIKWGLIEIDMPVLEAGPPMTWNDASGAWPYYPDALLREPHPGACLPCVGTDYEHAETVRAGWCR